MFEKPYSKEYRCAGCGYPIPYNWVADPQSKNREDPDYFHISCFNFKEQRHEANKQSRNS